MPNMKRICTQKNKRGPYKDSSTLKGETMSYINWKVESFNVEHPGPNSMPGLDVNLVGFINNYGAYKSRSVKEIVQEIENKLNKDDRPQISYKDYAKADVEMTKQIYRTIAQSHYGACPSAIPPIKDVIFHDPATIVYWVDGTKTVVKCQEGDIYDPEKGLAMAITKKALGNQGNYCNELKKWLDKYEQPVNDEVTDDFEAYIDNCIKRLKAMLPKTVKEKNDET